MQPTAHTKFVPWIIWGAILQGLVIMQIFLGGGLPSGVDTSPPPAVLQYAPAIPALLAFAIRFLVIPRMSGPEVKVPVMVVGLALAETTGILGMLLIDDAYGKTQMTHLVISILAVVTMAPIYMNARPDSDPYQR